MMINTKKTIVATVVTLSLIVGLIAVTRTETVRFRGYSKFQTFDEFALRGEGEVTDTPFVYVKATDNEISVIPSNDDCKKRCYKFNQDMGGYWSSEIKIETDHFYYRYFFRDTIAELHLSWCDPNFQSIVYSAIFLHTKDSCTLILLNESWAPSLGINAKERFAKLLDVCRTYKTQKRNLAPLDEFWDVEPGLGNGYLEYDKHSVGDSLIYRCKIAKGTLKAKFKMNYLGEWGIRPGFEKATAKEVSYYPEAKRTLYGVYMRKCVDTKPLPADTNVVIDRRGYEVHRFKSIKEQYVMYLTINEQGKVYDIEPCFEVTPSTKHVVKLAKNFKYDKPAMRNGKPVKVRNIVIIAPYQLNTR